MRAAIPTAIFRCVQQAMARKRLGCRPRYDHCWNSRNMRRSYRSLNVLGILTILAVSGANAEERRLVSQEKLDCLIETSATLKIGAPVPGLIRNVLVDRGDVVRQGQLLAAGKRRRGGRSSGGAIS